MNYDTEVNVKYKEIEEELLEKIKTNKTNKNHENDENNNNDLGYSEEDVLQICNELYKHELLLVFKVDDISNKKVSYIMTQLWEKIKEDIKFLHVIKVYKNRLSQMDLEQTFTLMFNYSLFFALHKCIVSFLNNSLLEFENDLLELEKQINTIF
jgi:hypothetical protein